MWLPKTKYMMFHNADLSQISIDNQQLSAYNISKKAMLSFEAFVGIAWLIKNRRNCEGFIGSTWLIKNRRN